MKSYIVFGTLIISVAHAQQPAWGQCGGTGWTGQTSCATGYYCAYSNPWYSQCVPESGTSTVPETTASTTGTSTVPETTSSTTGTSTVPETTSSTTGTLTTATTPPTSKGDAKTKFVGVNIAGFDFGCATDGACNLSKTYPPLSSLGGSNGLGQMQHFAQEDNMNVFRLPVGWQYLQDSLGAPLNPTNLGFYDQLVQECLSTGAICIVDIHNYARWNGQIIGQGGPTNDQFANLWSQVAAKYANNTKVVFGLMNEPHDIDINEWAVSLQTAVNAIRGAGAASNFLLLAGSNYSSAAIFTTESAAALSKIKDSDGKTSKLIFDVHQYLDIDGSGTNATCTTNNTESFNQLASWLRTHDRKAFLTETGGGNTTSCMNYLCQQVAAINAASDVFVGIVGWAAGGFDDSFPLNETPTNSSGVLIDQPLLTACLAR